MSLWGQAVRGDACRHSGTSEAPSLNDIEARWCRLGPKSHTTPLRTCGPSQASPRSNSDRKSEFCPTRRGELPNASSARGGRASWSDVVEFHQWPNLYELLEEHSAELLPLGRRSGMTPKCPEICPAILSGCCSCRQPKFGHACTTLGRVRIMLARFVQIRPKLVQHMPKFGKHCSRLAAGEVATAPKGQLLVLVELRCLMQFADIWPTYTPTHRV